MRIYRDRFYVLGETPGLSGFRRWERLQVRIVSGEIARNRKNYVLGQFDPSASKQVYRLDNGHLPDLQPRCNAIEAACYLSDNPYSSAYEVEERPSKAAFLQDPNQRNEAGIC